MFSNHDVMWAAAEVTRQRDTPMHVAYMLKALETIRRFNYPMLPEEKYRMIIRMAQFVNNDHSMGIRTVPVTFANGTRGLAPELINRALFNLNDVDCDLDPVDYYREFESIHPFTDGNGRVGSLLYNWRMGTLGMPIAPPDLFGIA